MRRKFSNEREAIITVDGVNAEGWVISQFRPDTRRVGLFPDATKTSIIVALSAMTCTHN